jgi:serine/threonine protein phosphatase 1
MERAKVTKEDTLIFRDYVDGWSQPQVLDYLIELNTTNNCVFIRGNHDELLLHWLRDSKDNLMWYKHGGANVLMKKSIPLQNNYMLIFTVKRLLSRRKEPSFVHAGFTNMNGVTYEFFPVILLGQNLMGNCTVFRPKNKTQRFTLSKTTNVV